MVTSPKADYPIPRKYIKRMRLLHMFHKVDFLKIF